MQQLNAIGAKASSFAEQNVALVGIGTDDQAGLKRTVEMYTQGPFPFTILSAGDLSAFKAYRAYDDFEAQPLHATFLIDSDGFVRWQDISYQPFMDIDFLLQESRRLLSQPVANSAPPATVVVPAPVPAATQ
jgi:peroxiredoxin